MGYLTRCLLATSILGLSASALADDHGEPKFAFVQTNLVSNLPGVALHQDPALLNAWGVVFPPGGSFWVNGNNAGVVQLYDGQGVANTQLPSVTIPQPPLPHRADITGKTSTPTGALWNPSGGFALPGTSAAAIFLFDSEDGTITAWNPAVSLTNAVIAVDNSNTGTGGAVYKGLAFGLTATGPHLYATNFRAGTVDVFDAAFAGNLVDGAVPNATTKTNITGTFTDSRLPAGFAPFGIQNINGDIYVSYAQQDQPKHDPVAGKHLGFVDVFSTDGVLLQRLAAGGSLNAPWGMVQAPASFGQFGGDILVGNFGDGRINIYSPDGDFLDQLEGTNGKPLVNDELWALIFGGGANSTPDTLYFSAGPEGETNGLFGTIVPKQVDDNGGGDDKH
jgi:uncharacterized protein (TIGR03118 family)